MKKFTILCILLVSSHLVFSQETEEDAIEEIKMEENIPDEDIAIGFEQIENPPIYPGCENLKSKEQKECFKKELAKHIKNNFNYSFKDSLGLTSGKMNIFVMFNINKNGLISDVRCTTSRQRMSREAERVIKLLPKMKPGKRKGKKRIVYYMLNIPFFTN